MSKKRIPIYVADFETTVYENQTSTEVWAAACCDIRDKENNVKIYNNINDFMNYFIELGQTIKLYFHNLKFDGNFILHWLNANDFKQAFYNDTPIKDKEMPPKTYKYLISNLGQWYDIVIKIDWSHTITIYDSFKLLPFSLEKIGKDFETEHQKLNMKYEGIRKAYGTITEDEEQYLKNDVLVLKEALCKMFDRGHKNMTIGSCCLTQYRTYVGKNQFNVWYPHLNVPIPDYVSFFDETIDKFVRKSYKGGWCYLKKGCENKIYNNGLVLDVNSLYPSVMLSERKYPIGLPVFWQGDYIPDECISNDYYYFVRLRTQFIIKNKHLPMIQIKNDYKYIPNEWLETSSIWNKKTQTYQDEFINLSGEIETASCVLTLTETDFRLFKEHYHLYNTEILGGCYFKAVQGYTLFYEYLWHYKNEKINAKNGVDRTIAKLFSNNLYGKMATSDDSSYKIVYFEDDILKYRTIFENNKQTIYIPVGSAITSYAREFTIRTAQKNYDNFIYADTDSLHCNCNLDDMVDVPLDSKEYSRWKCEGIFNQAKYLRQKAYVEHIIAEDLKPCTPYYNIKYAGMGKRAKTLIRMALGDDVKLDELDNNELKFISRKLTIDDIKSGLIVPSNLKAKNIKGGILLSKEDIELK